MENDRVEKWSTSKLKLLISTLFIDIRCFDIDKVWSEPIRKNGEYIYQKITFKICSARTPPIVFNNRLDDFFRNKTGIKKHKYYFQYIRFHVWKDYFVKWGKQTLNKNDELLENEEYQEILCRLDDIDRNHMDIPVISGHELEDLENEKTELLERKQELENERNALVKQAKDLENERKIEKGYIQCVE